MDKESKYFTHECRRKLCNILHVCCASGLAYFVMIGTRKSSFLAKMLVYVSLFYFHASIVCPQRCSPTDFRAVEGLTKAMGSKVSYEWNFNIATNCCGLVGIRCDSSNRIVAVNLSSIGLKGPIPDTIAGMDQLMVLDLRNNSLKGNVPPGLLGLQRLQTLDMSMNELSGQIRLGSLSLPCIRSFNVSSNQFVGRHPVLVGSPELVEFDAKFNRFDGPINAAAICRASPRVQTISLSANNMSEEFPLGFGSCGSLRQLMLDSNALSGGLPDDLFLSASLERLLLQGNWLKGALGHGIGNLTNLTELDISSNRFSGAIPDVFGRLARLRILSLASNSFTGALPASLSNLSAIEVLNLNRNSLGGVINIKFSNMPKLRSLNLGSNNFSGPIPGELSSCTQLQILNLARNRLSGEIPDGFPNMSSLSFLSLSNNSLSNISQALRIFQHSPNLTTLVLTINFHGERMPHNDGFQGFPHLNVLIIANCGLLGSLPLWLARCGKLQLLDLSWNRLEGSVPPWLGNLQEMFYLDLSNNSLSGELPLTLASLPGLSFGASSSAAAPPAVLPFFTFQSNRVTGLQYNRLNSFPPTLDLSDNNLSGTIPLQFGNLTRLHVLDLSANRFSGPIPQELSGIRSLEILYLSHNMLTGRIPPSLRSLTFLSRFSVAYNFLVGQIPDGGQFTTFPDSSFEGNVNLCGGPLPPCTRGISASDEPVVEDEPRKVVEFEFKGGVLIGFSIAYLAIFCWAYIGMSDGRHFISFVVPKLLRCYEQ